MVDKQQPRPSIRTFNWLLGSIVRMKQHSMVLSLCKKMNSIDNYTLVMLINCYCHLNQVDFGFAVFGKLVKRGYKPDTLLFNILIKGLCRLDRIGNAIEVFDKMCDMGCSPNVVTYNTVIDGLCNVGSVDRIAQAAELFEALDLKNG
eukprot:TRINITY_DN11152_c0_g1_i1.p1 TRINITY_DN11152_c0_g1~~TRINITY_DN11152_c0_g1_i1.p1  ORF type:complete len:147 (-),score=19.86 TRINITY_DN11152_c0_g1_i1:331-771(-)